MNDKIKTILRKCGTRKFIIVCLALLVTISFSLSMNMIKNSDIDEITENTNYITKIVLKLKYSFQGDNFNSLILFICLSLLFNYTLFRKKPERGICKILLAVLFSFFMVFGYSYSETDSWDLIFGNTFQLFKATIKFIGYYILFIALINLLFDYILKNIKVKETSNKLYNFIFIKHSFIIPLIIILVCWIPYIIAYYPGILFQDSTNQVKQYFGYDIPKYSATNSVDLIDENVKITNHHPVIHTLILGGCVQIGKLLGNDNLGIFLYTILQIMLLASTLAYIINYMKKLKIPNWINVLSLSIFALLPIIPIYAVEITKDVPFVCFFIMYIIILYDLIKNASKEKVLVKNAIKLIVVSLLVSLFRNNGIYVIVLSLPFLAILDKLNRKRIIISLFVVILVYYVFNALLPVFKIASSSIREALSIPFQQTARYVKEYGNEVTDEEKNAIDKVLNYETLGERYDPVNADPVKAEYNRKTTTEDLVNYFKVWIKQFVKHPTVYIQATFNNTYGYFYPESNVRQYTTGFMINSYESLNNTGNFNYEYIKELKGAREGICGLSNLITKLPVTSWLINIAFNIWIILCITMYLIYSKKIKYIIYMIPYIILILVCIASPVNAFYRYAIPFIFAMPLTVGIFIDIIKTEEVKKLKERN